MKNKLKFRHDIFFILAVAGILGQLFAHDLSDWKWISLSDFLNGIGILIFFLSSLGCAVAYIFQKVQTSKIFAATGLGFSMLIQITILIISLSENTFTLFSIWSFLSSNLISLLLLWAFLRKKNEV